LILVAERIPETCESKTLLEKLQYLLDTNSSTPAKKNELTKINIDSISKCSPKNIHNLNSTYVYML